MDRRSFLKATALGSAGLALGGLPVEAKKKQAKTPLRANAYVSEPARKIAVVDSADVVVVGGGPAGFAAAVAAAREGADVLVLERQYFLGGLFTGCGVTPIINMYHNNINFKGEKAVYGIADELCARLREMNMLCWYKGMPKADPEAAKFVMEEMFAEAGVRLLYGVQAAEVVMSGDSVSAVILEGKSGRVAVNCRYVIEASGDGDILEWTGEDFTVWKDDIGAMWRIGNAGASKKGSITPVKGVLTCHSLGERGQDGLDMYNLTRVQIGQRKKIWTEAMEWRKMAGCEDLYVVDTPSLVGVRITRTLNSVRNVTAEGAATGRSYKDVIGFTGGDSVLKWEGGKLAAKDRKIWQVPYSALTPKKVANLLVAGRCFGFERALTYDAREIGTCLMTGQAAGIAAAMGVAARCSCRDIDVAALQSRLRMQKVKLDW